MRTPLLALLFMGLLFGCSSQEWKLGSAEYTVRQGDTLYSIGQRFEVSVEQLRAANSGIDPKNLVVGTRLLIPDTLRGRYAPAHSVAVPQGIRLRWPVRGGQIGSRFGRRWSSFHEGLDIRAPQGTAVYAAHGGVVVYSGSGMSGFGKVIIIRGSGFATVYAHNSRLRVAVGDVVRAGDRIADVGQTGRASGPHLHLELRIQDQNGRYRAVDPLPFLVRTL